ncbi:hypothetical protein ACFQE6_20040, partial [Natrinema soli]
MRFVTPAQYEWEGWGESTAVIVAMGLALAIAGIVQTLETPVSQPVVAFKLFVSLLVPTGLATGGCWLASRDVSPDVRWRVATKVSIGIVIACALGVWLIGYVTLEGGTIRDPLSLVTILAAVGGATGFVSVVRDPLRNESTDSTYARRGNGDSNASPSPAATAADRESTAGEPTGATTTATTHERDSDTTESTDVTATPGESAASDISAATTTSPAAETSAAATASSAIDAPAAATASTPSETTSHGGVSPHIDAAAGPDDPTQFVDSAGHPEDATPEPSPLPARDPGV